MSYPLYIWININSDCQVFYTCNIIIVTPSTLPFLGCHDDCCCLHSRAVFIPYSVQKET